MSVAVVAMERAGRVHRIGSSGAGCRRVTQIAGSGATLLLGLVILL